MTSQDGLALLRQMHERGEITDQQYDALRRHVLWGTPLPDLEYLPAPRSPDPRGGYVAGAAAMGPRPRYGRPPGHPAGTTEPTGQAPYAPSGSTGPLPPVGGVAAPRRHRHRDEAAPDDAADPVPTYQPPGRRHRHSEQAAPRDTTRRDRRLADPAPEPEPDRPSRRAGEAATKNSKKAKKRPRRRSVVAVLTSVVLALALAAGGVYWFELRRAGLPPTAFARQACGTVRDWQQAVDSSNATLIGQISRQQNKATIKADVTAYYTTIADRTDQLRTAILGLGPVDLPDGQQYGNSLAAAVGDQANGLRRLAGQAAGLDPAAATFPTDLQGVLTGADAAVSAVSAALARPAAGITTELRTTLSNEPTCAPFVG